MALALIGESILAAVLEVLMERVLSPMVWDFFKSQKIDDEELKKLKARMRSVSKLLNDAQEKQITDAAVKEWLDELKDAVYQADDFLDEIAYKALRLKLEGESRSQTCTDQLRSFLASLNPCRKGVREVQTELAKILRSLEELVGQKDVLGLIERIGEKPSSRITPTSSLVDESGVYGRDAEKEAIVKLLLADDTKGRHLDVISIVGMGGVGKTTLAQLLYKEIVVSNDRSQKSSFDLKAWVYVSEEFDVLKVTKDILKGVGSMNCDNMTEDQLHCELEKKLSGNKLLLVLDDVWSDNQSQWEFLLKPFMSVRQGSKIIVTTRNENVASIISSVSTHHIKKLSDDDCWLVLSKHAFDGGNFTAHPELELIGRQIARKCNGLPLAAKTLGSLLCSKRAMKEWMKILKSNFWELPNDNILSPLRLSYHYLPSHLKRCFSYCAIIPKGYKFTREEIVLLWMAEGFLVEPRRNNEMEEIGYEYFNELVARSFFQQSSPSSSLFVMHDLINDLARFASGDFCFRLEGDDSSKTTERTRHLSYRATKDDSYQTFKAIKNPQLLRTLLCPSGWPRHMIQQVEVTLPALHMQDVSSLLTPEKLDGTNYVEWALNAQNKIRGRKRWGFISGSKTAPNDTNSEEYEAWEDENCLIKSWLLDAMNKDIRSIFLRLPTAKEIWDMAKQTYSVSQDASKSYQLYCEVISVRQNGGSIISYWGKLQKLWQEIDAIDDCAMSCKADIEIYTTKVNSQRVYIFLAGLDSSLDGVRGRVLATVPLPNLQVTYAMVCAEANRQDAMMGGISTDGTAMATRRISTRQDNKKGTRKCTHCNGDNHVVDTCFKLHGYPEWHPKGKKTFANTTLQQQPVPSAAGLIAQTEHTYQGEDWQW